MNEDSTLVVFAVIAVAIALVGAGFSYYKISEFNDWMTGFATESATVNITISTNAVVNFTTENLSFGSGAVSDGQSFADIDTSLGTVVGGSWTPIHHGLVLENIGNVNTTVDINGGKNATQFLGGANPIYQYNVTDNETGSCVQAWASDRMNTWKDVNTTVTPICRNFSSSDGADQLRIDFKLRVPSDVSSGTLGDVITITYTGQ